MSKNSQSINYSFLNELSDNTIHVKKGKYLYRKAEVATCVMFIFSGSVKTIYSFESPKFSRVDDFHIKRDLIGLDAMAESYHKDDAVALEDTIIKTISFDKFNANTAQHLANNDLLNNLRARYIQRKEETRQILGNPRAETRMAAFFINLTSRMGSIGYSTSEVQLKMSNKDIANFLGVKGETVSRAKKSLIATGAIQWDKKEFKIVDLNILKTLVNTGLSNETRLKH